MQYKNKFNVPDLYRQDGGSYYYTKGWNVQALAVMIALFVIILYVNSSRRCPGSMTALTCWDALPHL